MKIQFKHIVLLITATILLFSVQAQVNLQVTLLGIPESKMAVYSIAESKNNLIKDFSSIKKDQTVDIAIQQQYLPGEFILYFEYGYNPETGKAYSNDKMIIINDSDVEFFANPIFINNPDSSYFGVNDIENKVLAEFATKTLKTMEMLDILKTFLFEYDDKDSDVYKAGVKEFKKRQNEHNNLIDSQLSKHKDLFCSNMFYFYYVEDIDFLATQSGRQQSIIDNYFNRFDFSNKQILRVSYLKNWMDNYVNQYVELATSYEMIGDLFVFAGKNAIEKSKSGDPYVYGWMVDYFFNGYESMNIEQGISMLEPYINDPNCMTYKRTEINRRIIGIENLKAGSIAPDFSFKDNSGNEKTFQTYQSKSRYKLVLFWSADCEHCHAIIDKLYKWQIKNTNELEVFALSLDESDTEIPKWEIEKEKLKGWVHILTAGGINSTEANAYFVLSTPSMFLVDAKTNKIVAIPMSFEEILENIK